MKKTIKIKFVDFASDFNPYDNDFINILNKRYEVQISDHPDYIFYSCFGFEYLKYNCIRIFYTGECITPDFNTCDYAIGFDYLSIGDRYIRVPLYMLFQYRNAFNKAKNKHLNFNSNNLKSRKFCSFVVSNDRGQSKRTEVFMNLCRYKMVSSGGKYLNNIGYCVQNKIEFESQFKFSICFENCEYKGYTTEKIVQAFAAGSIPIYYGNPDIDKEFNSKSFINCHENKSISEIVQKVIEVDTNDKLYLEMLKTPILVDRKESEIDKFLYSIFDQDIKNARRRPLNRFIEEIENRNKYNKILEKYILKYIKRLRNFIRRVKNHSWRV